MRRALALAVVLAARPLVAQDPALLDPRVRFVVSGGAWRVGASHGYMRLIVLEPGAGRPGARLVIQWIERTDTGMVVRDSRAVTAIGAPWQLGQPVFGRSTSWIRATVTGRDSVARRSATWTISLGPPGQYSVSLPRP